MIRRAAPAILACAMALLAAGCAPTAIAPPAATTAAPRPAETAAQNLPPSPPAPVLRSPAPRPEAVQRDQCGAAELQRLVGRPRSEIPVPVDPNHQRVACTACPVTEDFDPGRLNFFFDRDTGLIQQVRCG